MQSNCTYSNFGTIHVIGMLAFLLEEKKWQLCSKVFTPSLHSLLIIGQDVILTCQGG